MYVISPSSPLFTTDMPKVKQAWDNMLHAFGGKWNVMALDLKNEPHGAATWGSGKAATDWNKAAEDLAKHVYQAHPTYKGLVFIEGTQLSTSKTHKIDGHNKWWGGDLEGVRDYPIDLGNPEWNKKVVYSPHVYGPDAFLQVSGTSSKGVSSDYLEEIDLLTSILPLPTHEIGLLRYQGLPQEHACYLGWSMGLR